MGRRVLSVPTAVAKLRPAPLRADGLHETRLVDRDMGRPPEGRIGLMHCRAEIDPSGRMDCY